ncbi:DUF1840 domain-containing protein [Pelomonas sp. APW6]|uniref:DUF1840 domain-containing protein n=1 Tax=Roseateles subflavus TaxID=3053353 RepID=A0ABT7LEF9_9BURK|nr:DUF1840 domain-containing protein [Pelomonas sp. APW6]MDL5031244.1 DUF1840 domain-containing protein [Pelomonas sp. APW6]
MIYRFRSRDSSDVLMLAPEAQRVLRTLGREPAPMGLIQPEAMGAAITSVENALREEEALREADLSASEGTQALAEGTVEVSLHQRIWPLLDMMRRAHQAGQALVWSV